MPLLRCEIKNEYGLGDPELYEESGSDDPEALLEGVAMAGLVGVLRQIGDLAEFAAEVFHGLHEQIVTTSARGHRLMLCVQQLEIEFPAVEKKVLSQTTHSHLPNNAGIDWHPSNHLDQNLITQQDMPRFVLNSYEESRGPPQLFILDKFDVAGAGACLKRYTDPSLFKTNDSSFRTLESEIQREKKSHKTRKKGTHSMHTKTINSFMKPDEKSIPTSDPKSLSLKRAKLKTRHVNSLTNRIGTSYMECIIDSQIVDQNQNDIRGKYSFSGNKKSVEAALEVHEIVIDSSSREKNYREIKQSRFIIKHNRIEEDIDGLGKEKGMNRVSESLLLPNDEVSKSPLVIGSPTFNDYREFNDTEKLSKNVLHESEGMAVLDMAGSGAGEIGNNVSKFDYDNELENYVDALTAMECEMETDYQSSVPNSPHKESPRTSSDSGRVGKHAKLTPSLDEKCSLDSVEHLGNFIDTGLTEKNEDHTLECEKSLSFSSMNLLEKNSNRDLDTTSLSELPENMEESTPVWPSSLPENMKESAIFMSSDSFKIVNESTKIMPSESPKTMKESAAVKLSETPDNINDNYICRSKESDVLNALHEPCYASYDPQSGSEKKSNIYGASGSLEILDEYLSASEDPNAMFLDQERDIKSTTKGLDEGNLICTDILSKSEETVLVGDSGNPDVLSDAPSPRQMDNNDGLYPIMTYNLIHENELFSENIVDGSSPDAHTHSSTCSIPEKTVLNNFSQDSSLHSVKEPSELINHNLEIDDGIVKAPHFDGDSEDSRHEKLNENVDDDIVYGNIQNLQSKHFPTKENEVFSETKTGDNPCPHLLEVASDTFNDKERNDSIIVTEIPVDSIMIENSASVFCSETSSNSIEDDKSFELNSISPSSQDTSGSEFKMHDSIQELKDKIQVESVSGSEFKIHDSTQELKNKIDVESLSGSELKMHDSIQESSKIHVESVSGSEFKIHDSTQELKNKIDVESVSGSEFKTHDSTQELKNKIDLESVSGSEFKIHDSTQELKNKMHVESVSGSEFKTQEESISISEFKIHDSTKELKNNKLSSPYDNTLGLTSEETSALLCSKQENENTSSKLGPEDHPFPADMNNHGTVDSTDSFVALVPNNTQIDSSNNTELSYSQSDVREVDMVLINSDQSDGSLAVEFQSSTPEGFEEPDVQQPQIIRKMETPVCLDNSCVSSINVLKELLADETKQVTGVSENGIKKNDSDDSLCDTHHQNHSEVEETYKSIQSSSELFVKSLENISVTNMHTQINLLPQNGLQDSVADTPLPPLPPLQWRLGKHGLGSKIPFGATSNPTSRSKSPIKSFLNSSASGILPLLENNQQPQVNDANSGSRQTVSSNPILFKSVTNDDKQNLSQHRSHGDEKIQSMSLYMPVPSSTMQDGMHQHNHYIPDGEMFYVPYSVTSEINPDQQNGKPRSSSILNRPKNPLIEAVASHDRSTLRKVSEMDLPKVKSKLEENDTLLEQIRNQSFNLKSTSITKPQVNGPSTNLKLAAILEKANAIRQACVGSDEDDDGSWSDS